MTEQTAVQELARDPSSRKRFLSIAGGGAALSLLLAACGDDDGGQPTGSTSKMTASAANKNDLEIVNYALTLEFLEADFYRQALASGELKTPAVRELAMKFGETEQAHVAALKQTAMKLGGTPATAPKTAFEDVLSGGEKKIVATAAQVENLGAAAYLGQAARIQSKEILAAALAIHTVEARHAAALNTAAGYGFKGANSLEGSLPDGAFGAPLDMAAVMKAATPFIASS